MRPGLAVGAGTEADGSELLRRSSSGYCSLRIGGLRCCGLQEAKSDDQNEFAGLTEDQTCQNERSERGSEYFKLLSQGCIDQLVAHRSLCWVSQDFAESPLEQQKEPFKDRCL